MEELIDIYTVDKKFLRKAVPKSEVHRLGHYHHTAHLWLYNNKGEILLAQRAASKVICPLLWDVSVAGHVDSGETIELAVLREAQEELGLNVSPSSLQKIAVFDCFQRYDNGMVDNEFHNTFISLITAPTEHLKLAELEVNAVKFVSPEAFRHLLAMPNNNHFIKSHAAQYKFVLQEIQKAVQNL